MWCGIAALAYPTCLTGPIAGVVALILGFLGLKSPKRNRAYWGMGLGSAALLIYLVMATLQYQTRKSVESLLSEHSKPSESVSSAASTWRDREAAAASDPNLFVSGLAGVSVTKPPEWRFVSNAEISEIRSNISWESKDFEEMSRNVQVPVVSIMKYPDTHIGASPTVQIGVRSKKHYPTTDPLDLLSRIVPLMKSHVLDFAVLEHPRSTQIDTIPAATVTYRYTLQLKSDENLPALTKLYYAVNSENFIIIGMSSPPSGVDKSDEEFADILQSLRLAR